ncbi:hypothetical protein ACIPYS_08940 [Kitasatospora sp. NPDC089913]|uniref:hypothetical protein n=1 Tax=Kitasatospora sp. NPDC089913 TaxID=3364080 RepID=UPI00382520CD
MSGLLTELGKRLADRWLSELLIPGALFLLFLWTALTLRNGHALDWRRVRTAAEHDLTALGAQQAAARILVLLVLAGLLGTLGRSFGAALLAFWFAHWPRLPLYPLLAVRRWSARRRLPAGATTRYLPDRHSWMADRMRLLDERLDAEYSLRIGPLWSRLWVSSDDRARVPVTLAQRALERSAVLAAWGLVVTGAARIWWPAALLGPVLFLLGVRRARSATDTLAELVEAVVDTSQERIATMFGFAVRGGVVRPADARQINSRIVKGF